MTSGAGIYIIGRLGTKRYYVGSSCDIKRRIAHHKCHLRKGKHHSQRLQREWSKHGEAAFFFEVVETCDRADLLQREQAYLDVCAPAYNMTKSAIAPMTGRKFTAAHRAKISASRIGNKYAAGRVNSPETIEKMSAAKRGKTFTQAHRAALSRSHMGNSSACAANRAAKARRLAEKKAA